MRKTRFETGRVDDPGASLSSDRTGDRCSACSVTRCMPLSSRMNASAPSNTNSTLSSSSTEASSAPGSMPVGASVADASDIWTAGTQPGVVRAMSRSFKVHDSEAPNGSVADRKILIGAVCNACSTSDYSPPVTLASDRAQATQRPVPRSLVDCQQPSCNAKPCMIQTCDSGCSRMTALEHSLGEPAYSLQMRWSAAVPPGKCHGIARPLPRWELRRPTGRCPRQLVCERQGSNPSDVEGQR